MSKEFICTIKRSINGKYHLQNATKNSWVVRESHRTIKICSPNEDSIAFSLDRSDPEPFAFFNARLRTHNQKLTVAAMRTAARKTCAQRS